MNELTPEKEELATPQQTAVGAPIETTEKQGADALAVNTDNQELRTITTEIVPFRYKYLLSIDFTLLGNTCLRISDSGIKNSVANMLTQLTTQTKNYNNNVNDPTAEPDDLAESIMAIQNISKRELDRLKLLSGDRDSKKLARQIYTHVIKNCTQKLNAVRPAIETAVPLHPHEQYWQENRLRLEQQILLNDTSLAQAFRETLTTIDRKSTKVAHIPGNGVFICYAWPDEKNIQDLHLHWVQPFLVGLREHLHQAGIFGTKLDIVDNPPGGDIYTYMKNAEKADFVLLIGTETLLHKHEQGVSAVCNELIRINRKRKVDREKNAYKVFPLLLSGSYETAFPAHYELYTTVRDWQGTKTYFQHLQWLIESLYQVNSLEFSDEWEAFYQKISNEKKSVLFSGLSKDVVMKKLALEEIIQRQQVDNAGRQWFLFNQQDRKDCSKKSIKQYNNIPNKVAHYYPIERYQQALKDKFADIEKHCSASEVHVFKVVIQGQGGAGKTELSKQFALDMINRSNNLVWILKSQHEDLLMSSYKELFMSYRNFSIEKGLTEDDVSFKSRLMKEINNLLNENPNWLLIFDNADNLLMDDAYVRIRDYIPTDKKLIGKIIITTRGGIELCDADCALLDLNKEGLELKEAADFLIKISEINNEEFIQTESEALSLATCVDRLPLTLATLALYLKKIRLKNRNFYFCDLITYLENGKKSIEIELKKIRRTIDCYAFTQEEIVSRIISDIIENDRDTFFLLSLCSMLNADQIPGDFLLQAWISTSEFSGKIVSESVLEELLNACIEKLQTVSLLNNKFFSPDIRKRFFYIHRVT